MITRKFTEDITPTPEELAVEFCDMNSLQQAIFFNTIAILVKGWDAPFSYQMQDMANYGCLSLEARQIMKTIGEYGEVS